MDDFVLNVRQIGNYPEVTAAGANDLLLIQINGLGGAYSSISATDLVRNALSKGSTLQLAPTGAIAFNGATLSLVGGGFTFNQQLIVPSIRSTGDIFVNGQALATQENVTGIFDSIVNSTVWSFNGRTGDIQLLDTDILRAGGVLSTNPSFNGVVTVPTIWNPNDNTNAAASTAFVQQAICNFYNIGKEFGTFVTSFNGRGGDIVLTADDITVGATQPGAFAQANTAPSGDVSRRIANTAFVDDAMYGLRIQLEQEFNIIAGTLDQQFAPINSPQFTGIPTGPTAAQTVNSGQLATTAFVHAAVTASTTGVSSFNTRTGAVVLTTADVTSAGGAPLASPTFTGIPAAPTATPGTATTQLATTAFVNAAIAAIAAGVTSFNTRTGAVTLTGADVTGVGGALLASPTFTGTPSGPTAAPGTNTAQFATTSFVTQALASLPAEVLSFNGRTGAVTFQASDVSAVGGALLASPTFTGVPQAPTATIGTSNTQIATTAFVTAAMSSVVSGVSSYNGRTGAVVPIAADITAAGGALLAGPTFTGVPSAPTATAGTNTAQLATTAFVQAALAAAPGGVSSFNGRTGAITLQASDVSGVGGALLASPSFTGSPTAPTPTPGNNSTNIATTAFVTTAIASAGGVSSFNGRAGVVTLSSTDVYNAEGAIYVQADTPPTTTPINLWFDSLHGQLYVQYIDPVSSAKSWVIANSPQSVPVKTPTRQVFYNSTTVGAISGTYATPAGVTWIEVEMVGGGGGGGGALNGGNGAGGNTTFGPTLIAGGAVGQGGGALPTTGDVNIAGGDGSNGPYYMANMSAAGPGGPGAASYFGGGGGGSVSAPTNGRHGGGGGGGAANANAYAGAGGGAGSYLSKIISSPSATYAYTCGTGGSGGNGTGGGYNGAFGGNGMIIVTEHYGS